MKSTIGGAGAASYIFLNLHVIGQLHDMWWRVCLRTEQEGEGQGLQTQHTQTEKKQEGGKCEREREREQPLQRQHSKGFQNGRKLSKIWMHFNNIDNTKECRVCKVKISYRAGPTNNLPSVQLEEKKQASELATDEGACSSTATVAAMSVSTANAPPQQPDLQPRAR